MPAAASASQHIVLALNRRRHKTHISERTIDRSQTINGCSSGPSRACAAAVTRHGRQLMIASISNGVHKPNFSGSGNPPNNLSRTSSGSQLNIGKQREAAVNDERWLTGFAEYLQAKDNEENMKICGESGDSPEELDPIWSAIRLDAERDAKEEPILSSFLYASILTHDTLEESLSFVIANRLASPTLLATQLMEVFEETFENDERICCALRHDLKAIRVRDPACIEYSQALLNYKGFHALETHRVAHDLWRRGQKVLALALQSRVSEVFAVDIHPGAHLGKGILLDHGTGIVIGETAVIGDNVSIAQGVTLGGTGKQAGNRHPKIHSGVLIGAGASILGNIPIGKGSMIAAGSLVLKPVEPHTLVAGTPASKVGDLVDVIPAIEMEQAINGIYAKDEDC